MADRQRHTISIRRSLSQNLIALILLLGAAILLTTVFTADRIRSGASRRLIDRAMTQAESDLLGFFQPAGRMLLLSRRWAETGVIDPNDSATLNTIFIPVLELAPQISSFNIGDAQGRGFLLLRLGDLWRNRRTHVDEWGDRMELAEFSDERTLVRSWTLEEPTPEQRYDPRTRAWYQVAHSAAERLEPGVELPEQVYWTDPYTFFTTGAPGITAAVHARGPDGRRFVMAIDILLTDLSDFTRQMEISENGFAMILDEQRRVIGLPRHPSFEDPIARSNAMLKSGAALGIPAVSDGAAALARRARSSTSIFSFDSGGDRYWADRRSFELGANRTLEIAVALPERDVLGVVQQQRVFVAAATAIVLLMATLLALVLSRRFSRPLRRLVGNSQRIGRLDLAESEPIDTQIEEVDQLAEEQERTRIALDAFSKYVPVELVRELLARGEAARIGGSERELTIVFSDVVGFTTIAEAMTPTQLTSHMAEYFACLLKIIQADGYGDVNEIAGDGIVAFWGAPSPDERHSQHAVDAVLRCRDALDARNSEWRANGMPELPTCFGLGTGPVVVGNVGAPSRMSYAAVGDSVNVASRVEGLTRFYGTQILATRAVRDAAGDGFRWRWVDCVRVKGKLVPIEIHELLGRDGEVPEASLQFARDYEAAFAAFRERRFADACAALSQMPGPDLSVQRLLDRARELAADPPAADWEPVTNFLVK